MNVTATAFDTFVPTPKPMAATAKHKLQPDAPNNMSFFLPKRSITNIVIPPLCQDSKSACVSSLVLLSYQNIHCIESHAERINAKRVLNPKLRSSTTGSCRRRISTFELDGYGRNLLT
jgi:hypothetical protein